MTKQITHESDEEDYPEDVPTPKPKSKTLALAPPDEAAVNLPDPVSKTLDDITARVTKAKAVEARVLDAMTKAVKKLGDAAGDPVATRKTSRVVAHLFTALHVHGSKIQEAEATIVSATEALEKALTSVP